MFDEPRFNFAKAANYFLSIKTAEYAPPDLTGNLEGQFLAPKEEVVSAITQLIENELKTGYAYLTYANTLRSHAHHSIAEEFMDHAAEETEHTEYLLRRLAVLAGAVPLPDIPAPPPSTEPEEIIDTMIRIEQEGIGKWRILRSLIGDENPMRYKIEEFLTREQQHLDELWQLRPYIPDTVTPSKEAVLWQIGSLIKRAAMFPGAGDSLASTMQTPPIPQSMTPSGAVGQEREQGTNSGAPQVPLPEIPEGISPDQMDPEIIQQLALEEQGRKQQQQASEAYYAQQATEAQKQVQQLQQQLQMQMQQVLQLQMQMQQEQDQKQQAMAMAQQFGETANQALNQQLQAQQQAIQSRQLAIQTLSQQDQFKQQLRELIDPPPPPPQQPPPMGDPTMQDPMAAQGQGMTQNQKMAEFSIRDAIRPLWDVSKDQSHGRNPALTVGLPVAVAFAAGAEQAYQNSKKGPARVEEARQKLQKAEEAYKQDKSYTNAMRLLAAKGTLSVQELRRDYPAATAMATMPLAYGTTRATLLTGYEVLPKIKKQVDKFRSIKSNPQPHPGAEVHPPIGKL